MILVRRHGTHYRRKASRPDTVKSDSETFRACLKQTVHQHHPDLVQLEFTQMAQYAKACAPAKTILVEHDITLDLASQLLNKARRPKPPATMRSLSCVSRLANSASTALISPVLVQSET